MLNMYIAKVCEKIKKFTGALSSNHYDRAPKMGFIKIIH
jgi:hypothetical protein